MINRTLLRTKAVQLLYAFQTSKDTKSIAVVESEIVSSLQKTYELYYQLLKLSVELTRCAEERIEMGRNKFRPTPEERNPNMRFVNNLFICQLDEKLLEIEKEKKYVSIWRDCPDVLKRIFE
jgi:N utilization substance protein B